MKLSKSVVLSATSVVLGIVVGGLATVAFDQGMLPSRHSPPGLWATYDGTLKGARYIDLTHAFAPGQPRGAGLAELSVSAARAASDVPGVVKAGEAIGYDRRGVAITAYSFGSDQIGTQLDPPAHWSDRGATISDLPPTYAVRPLVVVDVSAKVRADPGYVVTPADIAAWEARHGRVPAGSVVMIRSGWSRLWSNPARFAASPHPGVGIPALQLLHLERRILFHGHETLDTDDTPNFAAEAWLLRHDFAQAENVANLDQLPEAGALIVIGFARPLGGTGGMARFVAIVPPDWPHGVTIAEAPGAPLPRQPGPLKRGPDGVLRPAS